MELYIAIVRLISRLAGYVAASLIALSVVVVCEMVFVRYVLNQTTIWQTDFVTWSLVAATFVGSPYVLMLRGHVGVDVLPLYLGPKLRYRLALFSGSVTLFFGVVMTIVTFLFWKEAFDQRWVSETMWRARLWIPYSAMPIGLFILTLQCIADFGNLVSGREPPFGLVKAGPGAHA